MKISKNRIFEIDTGIASNVSNFWPSRRLLRPDLKSASTAPSDRMLKELNCMSFTCLIPSFHYNGLVLTPLLHNWYYRFHQRVQVLCLSRTLFFSYHPFPQSNLRRTLCCFSFNARYTGQTKCNWLVFTFVTTFSSRLALLKLALCITDRKRAWVGITGVKKSRLTERVA